MGDGPPGERMVQPESGTGTRAWGVRVGWAMLEVDVFALRMSNASFEFLLYIPPPNSSKTPFMERSKQVRERGIQITW